jgi:hypothetical protein
VLRRLLVVHLLAALTVAGLAVAPANAGEAAVLRVKAPIIGAVAGAPAATRIRLVSNVGPLDGRVVIRRVGEHRVASWPVSDQRLLAVRWDGTNRRGDKVRPGKYRVRAIVQPVRHQGRVTRVTALVRVVATAQPRLTRYGYVQPAKVRRSVGRYHLEVDEARNQLLVVDRRNRAVRQIPVAGNPAISKPSLSYVADRTPMSYDYAYTKRLGWFVRLVQGRGIGSHTIPRHISSGKPTMAVTALGRKPGVRTPVSAGCLRMHDVNARWVFHNVPAGTPVYWLR